MYKGEVAFQISKALEFVGDNSTYQKTRLFWISTAIFSYAALNSYIPIVLQPYQSTLFFISSAVGQLICPMYLTLKMTTKYLFIASIVSVISVIFKQELLQTVVFGILGFLGRGLYVCSFIYLSEVGGEKFRAWSFMVIFALSGLAPFVLALLSMFRFPEWLIMVVIVVLPHAFLYYVMMKRWYPSPIYCCEVERDYDKGRTVLNVIANQNGRPEFTNMLEGEDVKDILIQHKLYTHFDLFLMKPLKDITVPLAMLWFYREFIYYGSFRLVPLLGGQEDNNLILLSVSEIVAALMSVPIKLRVKRINAFFGLTAMIGLVCILVSFFKVPQTCYPKGEDCIQKYVYKSSSMVIRFCISLVGSIIMNYTIEVYPTKVRKLGFGVCLAAGSSGSVLMPLLIQFLVAIDQSPFIAFALLSAVMIYFIPWLPQTDGKITSKRVSEMQGNDSAMVNLSILTG